ncbi:hypothetical protein BH20ACI3_BH20ACI3_05980 [soil metagenome]
MKATVFTAFGGLGAGESQRTEIAKTRATKQMKLCWVDLFMARVSRELVTVFPNVFSAVGHEMFIDGAITNSIQPIIWA